VPFNPQVLCKDLKVVVGRQDRDVAPERHRADQKVRVRALGPLRSTAIEARRSFLVVLLAEWLVEERSQGIAERLELFDRSNPKTAGCGLDSERAARVGRPLSRSLTTKSTLWVPIRA
jgi:hypothetical protein